METINGVSRWLKVWGQRVASAIILLVWATGAYHSALWALDMSGYKYEFKLVEPDPICK